ncbi:cation/H(+) antiporter 24-like protein [Tanacetum coccineum]
MFSAIPIKLQFQSTFTKNPSKSRNEAGHNNSKRVFYEGRPFYASSILLNPGCGSEDVTETCHLLYPKGTFVTSLDNANMGIKESTIDVGVGTKEDVNNVHGTTVEEPNVAKQSFTAMFKKPTDPKAVNLTKMNSDEVVQGANVAIPLAAVEEISKRFDNTLYGLSLITSQLGRPIMLDAYTSTMCQKSWGRNTYPRALVEVSLLTALKESLVVAIPYPNGSGHSLETMEVEYEWHPPRCDTCKIFDHWDLECPKREKVVAASPVEDDDGFTQVTRKNRKGKQDANASGETSGDKQPTLNVSPIQQNFNASDSSEQVSSLQQPSRPINNRDEGIDLISLRNSFETLMERDKVLDVMHMCAFFKADKKEATGTSTIDTGMRDFQSCVEDIEVSDVNSTCLIYTWNQNPNGDDGILKKIDQIMANMEFLASFVGASALFQPYRILDPVPAILRVPMLSNSVSGFWMFKVVKRLKFLKKTLRKLLYDHGNIYENVKKLRNELDDAQMALDSDPNNVELREEEAAYLQAFNDDLLMEERFLMQKEKVEWLKLGDANTAYFYKVMKSQASRNRIDSVTTSNGVYVDGDQVSDQEIREAIFCMGDNKAPGPDEVLPDVKVNIQKVYDTVDWKFLMDILIGFGFHPRMIGWIMKCVTSTSFSLSINGSLHGYFKGKRGLRQGNPMSLYLFTLVIEVLTLMLHRRARASDFTYHRYCSKLNIINLCFADDLFLFAHGDVDSARILPFEEGKLPVKYLGVPLVPSRLLYRDCVELMEKVKRRISDWKNKSLSLVRRVQLIREMRKGKAKVTWEDVCIPKREGGLGIRRLEGFNKALISTHIWSLLLRKESLWVKWIHTYKLNGRTFWEIPLRATISAWFDNWCALSPLASFISNRDIYRAGLGLSAKVNEIIDSGMWSWPTD